jgi:hypothetical protein
MLIITETFTTVWRKDLGICLLNRKFTFTL